MAEKFGIILLFVAIFDTGGFGEWRSITLPSGKRLIRAAMKSTVVCKTRTSKLLKK
jgi:hypothetical protein